MDPAPVLDIPSIEEERPVQGVRKNGIKANWRILAVSFYMGIALLEYGFDQAMAGFQAMPGFLMVFGYQEPNGTWGIHATPQQIISSFMTLGVFIGSLFIGPIGSFLGRRHSVMLSATLLLVSVIIMIFTTSFGVLYFARLLIGIANGMLLNFTLVYLQECAPPHLRGLCMTIVTIWITIGSTVGMVILNATAGIMSRKSYQILLYVCLPAPVILVLTLPFLPESPRWLLHHGQAEASMRSLRFLRKGTFDDLAVQEEFEEMKAIAAREAETTKDWRLMLELFRGHNLRRTIVCVGTCTANAGVGAMFILGFGTYFFEVAKVSDPFKWTIITNCIGLIGMLLTWFVVTRVGRRVMILIGTGMCTICMLIMAAIYTPTGALEKKGNDAALVILISTYIFGFNFGLTPYAYMVIGELPAQNLRAYTMGLSIAVSFVFAWLSSFTTPYYINPTELNWGPKFGYVWFVSGLIVCIFIYFALPEVRGRSLEEIDEMFRKRVPTRQFSTYVCVEADEAKSRAVYNRDVAEKQAAAGGVEHTE